MVSNGTGPHILRNQPEVFRIRTSQPGGDMPDFLQKCAWWLCAGVGFDPSQRLLDHFVDIATDRYSFLA